MGIALSEDRLAVGGKGEVWSLREHSELAPAINPAGRYDRCWLPRSSTVTGVIQCQEVAWGTRRAGDGAFEPDLWIVNPLFSCLAGLDPRYSFVPRWRPPFISELAAQDRCHLNGMAIRETAVFGGVPIAAHHEQLKCGVGVVELATGNTVATLQFASGVDEIFDVQVASETRCPTFGGPPGDSDEIWLLPGENRPEVPGW